MYWYLKRARLEDVFLEAFFLLEVDSVRAIAHGHFEPAGKTITSRSRK